MKQQFDNIKPAVKLINLTDATIQVYDQHTGEIVSIPPEVHVLPKKPKPLNQDSPFYYVFEKAIADQLEKNGRSLEDIAIINSKSHGRDDSIISNLVWGNGRHTGVIFCPEYGKTPFI